MDIAAIPLETVISNGLFAVLFVWLLFDTRKEAKERETRLYEQIETQNDAQSRIVESLERLEHQIATLQEVR